MLVASQVVLVKNLPANMGDIIDAVSTPGFREDLPRGGHGNSLQYFLPGETHGQRSWVSFGP